MSIRIGIVIGLTASLALAGCHSHLSKEELKKNRERREREERRENEAELADVGVLAGGLLAVVLVGHMFQPRQAHKNYTAAWEAERSRLETAEAKAYAAAQGLAATQPAAATRPAAKAKPAAAAKRPASKRTSHQRV